MKTVVMAINSNKLAGLALRAEGMALALVLVFTASLLVIGAAVITYAVNEKLIASYNCSDIRLLYIVESGLETGIAILGDDFYYDAEITDSCGGGSFTVYFTDEYQHYRATGPDEEGQEYFEGQIEVRFIRSVGTLGEHSKVRSIAVEEDGQGSINVLRWYKVFPVH